jgi:hypothetical protein
MKFTISYVRKFRTKAYETCEIGLIREFDTAYTTFDSAFRETKTQVETWIAETSDELLEKSVTRPQKEEKVITHG